MSNVLFNIVLCCSSLPKPSQSFQENKKICYSNSFDHNKWIVITIFLSSAGTIINTTCPLALLQSRSLNYHQDAIVMLKRSVIICMQFLLNFLDNLAKRKMRFSITLLVCFSINTYISQLANQKQCLLSWYINNSFHVARKFARIFVRGHYLFWEANSFPRASLSQKNCELSCCKHAPRWFCSSMISYWQQLEKITNFKISSIVQCAATKLLRIICKLLQ